MTADLPHTKSGDAQIEPEHTGEHALHPLQERPPAITALPADIAAAGPVIPALDRLRVFSPGEWEDFVQEWAHSLKADYAEVQRCSGAGDLGRDVVGIVSKTPALIWDNFQCKHFDHALFPSDAVPELGKLLYYTSIGRFTPPRRYRFCAPHGVGSALALLLADPDALRDTVLSEWERWCARTITKTKVVVLDAALRAHISAYDFATIDAASPLTLIEQHRRSPWHAARFGGGLPARPAAPQPPAQITSSEIVYVRCLLDAYEEHTGATFPSPESLTVPELLGHLRRARKEFFSAEALRKFSEDSVPPGTFQALLDDVHDGVIDVHDGAHTNGYARVLRVVEAAKALTPTANALVPRLLMADKGGMCHQLANEERFKWRHPPIP